MLVTFSMISGGMIGGSTRDVVLDDSTHDGCMKMF